MASSSNPRVALPEQGTFEWKRQRLGKFTGSRVGDLMTSGRGKNETFGKTALSYIYEIAGERDLSPRVLDEPALLQEYFDFVEVSTKAMRWGTEQEADARVLYAGLRKVRVEETGSVDAPDLPGFASSPDGLVDDDGCLEIKCPSGKTATQYRWEVTDAASLKSVNSTYYWQCMSHMYVTGRRWCDFVVYMPFSSHPLHIVRIERDEDAISAIRERVTLANALIREKQGESANVPESAPDEPAQLDAVMGEPMTDVDNLIDSLSQAS